MSENSKSLKNLNKINILILVSVFLIILSRGLYYGMSLLSLIIVIISTICCITCFWWLFKQRKNSKAKNSLEVMLIIFIMAIWYYLYSWSGGG